MVEHLNNTFHALSDPTRRAIIAMLIENDTCTIKDISSPFTISLAAISKHVQVLEKAQLVTRKKKGRDNHISLNPKPLKEIKEWLNFYESFWTEGFERLEKVFQKNAQRKKTNNSERGK